MYSRKPQSYGNRRRIIHLATLIALLVSLFPSFVPGLETSTASAHNLDATAVYVFLDPATQAIIDARIASGTWTPGTPVILPSDELGVIIKAVPDNGTTTGVGGYTTFYLPDGVQVVDAAFVAPDGSGGYTRIAAHGQAAMPSVGAGGDSTVSLVGEIRGPNILGVTSPIVTAANTNLGTIVGVYGDTGIFYSTDPSTALGTYSGGTLTNNSGDIVGNRTYLGTPLNKWDAWQMAAYGIKGTTNPAYPSSPIIDSNGRGYAPWGLANAVAGPESGYAWEFDLEAYKACTGGSTAPNAACIKTATSTVGPWQRIQYPGSQISDDPPGANPAVQPYTRGANGSTVGHDFDLNDDGIPDNPLPATTGQSNGTPNAVRWAYGQLTELQPEFAWVKIKVTNPAAVTNASGCPEFKLDTFGGDAGGDSGGKDHIWRYYDPNSLTNNLCLMVGKPASRDIVKPGDTFQYNVKVYNLSNFDMHNVVVTDLLPSGVSHINSIPVQNSGPNPLVWNVGTLAIGKSFKAVVTVKATSSGVLENTITVVSDEVTTTAKETTISGSNPLLVPSKSVTPTSIAPGGTVQWTVKVKNVGSGPSGSPTAISEYLPTGFTYQSLNNVTVNGASYTGSTTVGGTATVPTFSVPTGINANNELLLTFTAKANAGISSGTYCNSFDYTQNGIRQTTGSLACVIVGGGRIGDTVFRDWNGNGVQDAGEEGIPGVTVSLSGDATQSVVTDANGNYVFTGLNAGNYVVTVPTPSGYTPTLVTSPAAVTLALNEQRLDVDFGYKPGGTGSIGDLVYKDIANDGVFNGADTGIPNVTVWLYEDTNGNGAIDIGDLKVMTATTDGSGIYGFGALATGLSYIVDVDETDGDLAAVFTPDTFTPSTPALQPVPNLSGVYLEADFGYFPNKPNSIGDQVFIDANNNGLYDGGETLLPGVTVNLYRDANGDGIAQSGELAATTSTNITGTYTFGALGPGPYIVVVDNTDPDIPGGYAPSISQFYYNLTTNQNITTADFPFVPLINKQVSKTKVNPGETLYYTITANYPGTDLLSGVYVTDSIPAGATYVAASANAGGVYSATTNTITWPIGSNTQGEDAFSGSASGSNSFRAVQDTKLQINNPTNNYGTDTTIQLKSNDLKEMRALAQFNVTSLAGQTVSSANLRFYVNNNGSANTRIDVYPLTRSWTGTSTNWTKATASANWSTAGGDFNAANLLASFVPSTNNQYYSVTSPAINALVQNWINNSATNYGVILVMRGDVDEVQIRSVEESNPQKPELVVVTGSGTTTRNPSQDTFIDQGSPTTINATANPLKIVNSGSEQRGLVQWDVSSLPPAAQVVNASVKFYFTGGNSNVKVNLFRAVKSWTQGVGTNGANADWLRYDTGNAWANPGGDYTTNLGNFQAPSANNTYKSYSSAALATLVQGWIDGSITNQGILLLPTATSGGQSATFASSENGTQLFRPELVVTYLSNVITQTVQTKIPVGPVGGQDTYINVDSPGNNYGTDTTLVVKTPSDSAARAVLHFDLSSLSGTVNSTVLTFTVNNATAAGSRVEVYPLTKAFNETQATWNIAATGTPWTTAGGDYNTSNLIGSFSPTTTGVYTVSGAALNALVQSWINSGATNFGLLLVMRGIDNDAQIRTREQGTPDQPKLSVTTSGTTVLISDRDTELRESNPTNNYGTANAMAVVRAGQERRGIVQWDLSAYQPDVTVTAASMRFNVNTANAAMLVNLRQALQSWTEGNKANGSDADWLNHDTGVAWATPGGDFSSTVLGSFTPSATGWVTITNPAILALVQGWLDGSIANNGIFLTGSGTVNQAMEINSVGTVDNVLSPQLLFTFNTNSRATKLTASPSLVSNGGPLQVSMQLSATQTITNVTPTLLQSGTNGATATCGSPSPASATVAANVATVFTWTCTANAGSLPGELTFTGSATSALGANFALATANSVLIAPPLTFRVIATGAVDPVENRGYIQSDVIIPPTPSNVVQTAILASIGDTVFADLNGNGVQDVGEAGLSGVQVCATPVGGGAAKCAITDGSGAYRIFGLDSNTNYTVALTPATVPAGYLATTPSTLTVTSANFASTNNYYSAADFGLRPPGGGSIGDTVWLDSNENGSVDGSETGLPGITVQLYDAAGTNLLATTTTNASGLYTFTGLYSGTYKVQVVGTSVVTTSYGITSTLTGAMDLVSVAGITTTLTNPLTVNLPTDSSSVDTADFGYNWSGQVGDLTFYDNNGNGVFDGGDAPAPYVTQVLYYDADGSGTVSGGDPIVAVVETNGSGAYLVENLPPGNYVMDPDEQTVESPTTPGLYMTMITSSPETIAFTLGTGPGQSMTNLDVDSGFIERAIVEGFVFHDVDSNGLKDGVEPGLPLVSVTISGTDIANNPVNITIDTDPTGEYKFVVPPGTYTISYNTADGDIPAALGTQTTPTSTTFTALAGSEYSGSNFDFGLDNTGAIGDRVWNDSDGNGVQNGGEPGLPGTTVQLYASNGITLLATTVTTGTGGYLFPGLADDTYVVKVVTSTVPANYNQTFDADGLGTPHQSTVTLTGGVPNLLQDFGYQLATPTFSVSGTIFEDANGNSVDDDGLNITGVNVTLVYTPSGGSPTTLVVPVDGNGDYSVSGIPQGSNIAISVDKSTLPSPAFVATTPDLLTITNITSNQTNKDFGFQQQFGNIGGTVCDGSTGSISGQCEVGESPLTGVTITLLYAGTDGSLNTSDDITQTMVTTASGVYSFTNLLPGLYQITETNPVGYVSLADADGGAPDNISPVNLAVSQTITDRDFEDTPLPSTIAGGVYNDLDGNGAKDGGEPGLPGVLITLSNGLTTTTDASGLYTFTLTVPGTYTVTETNPAGYISTGDTQGPNDDEIVVTVAAGQTSSNNDFLDKLLITLTGTVFDDANGSQVQDGLESGTDAGGLFVNLVDGISGNVVATTTVDANGLYTFTSVAPSTSYTLSLTTNAGTIGDPAPAVALPAGWVTTGENDNGTPDGTPNSQLPVTVGATDVTEQNFGIEQLPDSDPVNAPSQVNPGGTISVTVPVLSGTDPEDGPLTAGTGLTLTIVTTPTNGTLYYDGVVVTPGQVIPNYDDTKLTVDPDDGPVNVTFTYAVTDAAGETDPTPATVSMPFGTLSLTGTVFDDADGSQVQNGLEPGTNAGGLNVNLLDSSGTTVVETTPVDANGLYTFTSILPNTTYVLQLTTNAGTPTQSAPAVALPSGWVTTGENTAGTPDGTPNSLLTAVVVTSDVTQKNFGIEQLPESDDKTALSQPNPGGTVQVTVPTLSGNDPEDGPLGTGMTLTVVTTPTNGTLYYNGVVVTPNQVITNYDPTKLTVDPDNGAVTVTFTYAVTDAAGQSDPTPATVTMPFDAPDFVVTKTLNTPSPVRKGETISFTIRITNTGSITLTTVPLSDIYIDGLIVYINGTPTPDVQTSGLIGWNDLTTATANGFGRDLGIGDHFEVVVTFVGLTDTSELPGGVAINTATVHDASYDPDGPGGNAPYTVADKSATAGVGITNPTAVALADAGASYGNAQVALHWSTVNESDVLGFHIYRSENGGKLVKLTNALVLAQKPGQSQGASYTYADASVAMGKHYTYVIEFIGADGPVGQADIGEVLAGGRIFLPAVGR